MASKLQITKKNFIIDLNVDIATPIEDVKGSTVVTIHTIKATCLKDFYPVLHKGDYSFVEDLNFFISEGVVNDHEEETYYMIFISFQKMLKALMFMTDDYLDRIFCEDAEAGAWQHA